MLGFPFAQLEGSKGWEDADTVHRCLRKEKGWEREPSSATDSEKTFPTRTPWLWPGRHRRIRL